jgi:hypothetical protein
MAAPLVVIFHHPRPADEPPLTRLLRDAQDAVAANHARLFERAGAGAVLQVWGDEEEPRERRTFGERLMAVAEAERPDGGLIVLGAGAVPLLRRADAKRLVAAASGQELLALTNNRYSSDVCAISHVAVLDALPPLPSDNALPRWLESRARVTVRELPARNRLAIDLDSPIDIALAALHPSAPGAVRAVASDRALSIPRLADLRALTQDPRRELVVLGRSSGRTLRWLERNVRCRVRFLAEERGLRASSPLASDPDDEGPIGARPPRSTLGRLLEARGPAALAPTIAELADGAIIDSRVLMADRLGADEAVWPPAEERFASDLQQVDRLEDPWLRTLTISAAGAALPILMGGHTLVGPGVRLLLR